MPSTLTPDVPVGRLATEHPLATRVFARHGIDFCCGGGRPLDEACRAKGLDPKAVLAEIEDVLEGTTDSPTRWATAPLADVVRHVFATYHQPHREELPRLEAMARKVQDVHGTKDARLAELAEVVSRLRAELESHMLKEDQILFPAIAAGHGAAMGGPIAVMEAEHDAAGEMLRRIRELTDEFRLPDGACNTWRALWHGLDTFERDLHEHVHLENNVLFPRALGAVRT
jgi:regulator of cell morphogenesis and NO signaling